MPTSSGPGARVNKGDAVQVVELIRTQRWAALGCICVDGPYVSYVAYVSTVDFSNVWLHLSRLAAHTQCLLQNSHTALAISAQDTLTGDPQTLPRVTLRGVVEEVPRGTSDYEAGRALYLQRLPEAEQRFHFGDFVLFRLRVAEARYVGGFARAYTLGVADLQKLDRTVHREVRSHE